MKDFLDKGMGKCPFKTKLFWDDKEKKNKKISIVCPEGAVSHGDSSYGELICLRNGKYVSSLTKCPSSPKKKKPEQPIQLDWVGN